MTVPSDLNGPDGCLSSSSDNAGLVEGTSLMISQVEPLWQKYCDKISRGDFWVLLAKLAIEFADTTRTININHQYGRKDKKSCETGGVSRLPNAQLTTTVQNVFQTKMNLTVADAVTLIGAHTIGHVHPAASGYGSITTNTNPNILTNAWDTTPSVFDNQYYVNLLRGWISAVNPGNTSKNIWFRPPGPSPDLMLNSDMALAYNIGTTTGVNNIAAIGLTCNNNNGCATGRPATATLVTTFANSNAAFLSAFAASFAKMTTVGYGLPVNTDGASASGKLGTLTAIDLTTCPI
jgi:catalase (peroxidase I)